MSFSLETKSVKSVLQNSKQVQVYGWSHCEYESIMEFLAEAKDSPVEKVFTDCLGDPDEYAEEKTTLQGREIEQIAVDLTGVKGPHRCDKAGLTNLVLENYKRELERLPLIPILFAIDIDDNRHPTTAETVTSRDEKLNSLRTHSELRRAYKLVQEFGDIAEKSLRFVKLRKVGDGCYCVEQIDAPWKDSKWKALWSARKAQSKSPNKSDHWKKQIAELKNKYLKNREVNMSVKMPEGSSLAYVYPKAVVQDKKVVDSEDAVVRFVKAKGQMSDQEISECRELAEKLKTYHVAVLAQKRNFGPQLAALILAQKQFKTNHADIEIQNLNIDCK